VLNPQPALLRGRRAAEDLMVDAVTITRTASVSTNSETGAVTRTPTTVYTGKCKVAINSKTARPDNVAEDQLFLFRVQVQLPTTAVGVQIDDQALITASVNDVELAGRTFAIREIAHGSFITARRLMAEEVIL
jgi:hypothetical protein